MNESSIFYEILSYSKLIVKKWYFLLLAIIDIAAVVIQYFYPAFRLPSVVYILIAIFSFFIAGFNVYRESLKESYEERSFYEKTIKEYEETLEKVSKESNKPIRLPNYKKIAPDPKLKINMIEGSEYSFSIDKSKLDDQRENKYVPFFDFCINLRIENCGNVDYQVIGINSDINLSIDGSGPTILLVGKNTLRSESGDEIKFPFPLAQNKYSELHFLFSIRCYIRDSELIYAAAVRKIVDKLDYNRNTEFYFKTLIPEDGSIHEFTEVVTFSERPLYELLLKYWEEHDRSDLVQIATGRH